MSATFTCTRSGTSTDYMRYLWGNPVKNDRKQEACLLDFNLVLADNNFVKLGRGDYIDLYSTYYGHWFTGYITNDPEVEYLGKGGGVGHWGYKYHATADEYILSLKQIGIIRPFMNVSMGFILRTLAESLCPGLFGYGYVQDGPTVAQYTVDPTKKFIDVAKELCQAANYVFFGKSHDLYFMPQDDPSFVSITLDGNNKHFTPSRLSMRPSSTPIINDAIVLGDVEPQRYMQEYFLGTGLQGTFPLQAAVFGADKCVLLQEDFSGSSIDLNQWDVTDPGNNLQVDSGYLNASGGSPVIKSINGIPLEGYVRLTHGEWDFISGSGTIAGLWKGATGSLSNCVYGLSFTGSAISPIVNGAVDTDQDPFTIDTAKRYIFRTLAEFSDMHRLPQPYSFISPSGVVTSVASEPKECKVKWHTIITEVDVDTGEVTNQSTFTNSADLAVDALYASYAPLVSSGLSATVSGITLSVPVNASLEIQTKASFANQSFDQWESFWVPTGWEKYQGVTEETMWMDIPDPLPDPNKACRMSINPLYPVDKIYISQRCAGKLQPFTPYDISVRVRRNPSLDTGTFKAYLQYVDVGSQTDLPDSKLLVPFFFDKYNVDTDKMIQLIAIEEDVTTIPDSYITFTGTLTDGLKTIPDDLTLILELVTDQDHYGSMWVDNMEITTPFIPKLLGPNEIDALDGLAPYATITSSNTGAVSRDPILGGPQYNAGQSQLVFFKDSVHRVSNVPTENQIVRISYRAAGTAVGRVVNQTSIDDEASAWGDDGHRAIIRKDLTPRPRSSYECELAAYALVSQNSHQHYEGSYTQFSNYFSAEPKAGCMIRFVNLDSMIPDLQAEEVTSVTTTFECEKSSPDIFNHVISFSPSANQLEKLLASIGSTKEFQKESNSSINPPPIDLSEVGLNYAEPITQPTLVSWSATKLTFDVGSVNGNVEVRSTDRAWGEGDAKNTITSTSGQFDVSVAQRTKVVYMKVVED